MLGVRKRSHRLALAGSAAAVVCLGGTVLGMGGEGREGWVASGPAGATDSALPSPSRPSEGVSLIPLDGVDASADDDRSPRDGTPQDGSPESPRGPGGTDSGADPANPGTDTPSDPGDGSQDGEDAGGDGDGPTGPGRDRPGPDPSPARPPDTAPPGPAELLTDEPVLADAEGRWCQKVTLAYRNTGDSAVRSGQVNFATHVIGLLGVDWATIRSAQKLPVPIDPGESGKKTYTVCVDAWRVPLGMHVETRDITVDWD